jgi:hypothetical protein
MKTHGLGVEECGFLEELWISFLVKGERQQAKTTDNQHQ